MTWSCEKFRDYILGKQVEIETDHKLLVPLLSNKRLDGLPPRVPQFRRRFNRYDYLISHIPGKLLYLADTLSRASLAETDGISVELEEEVETFISHVTKRSTEQPSMEIYHSKQAEDPVCCKVMEYCRTGWPHKHLIPPDLIPYWKLRSSFTIYNDVLLFKQTVIPPALQKETLQKIHEGHQDIY